MDIRKFFKSCEKHTGEKTLHSTDLINACDTENLISKGAFRLDAKQREAKVGDLREWSITSLAKVANLR